MSPVTRYALTFPGTPGTQAPQDVVVVERTSAAGPGGHPVYEDASGIVRAEISGTGRSGCSPPAATRTRTSPSTPSRCPDRRGPALPACHARPVTLGLSRRVAGSRRDPCRPRAASGRLRP